MAMIAATTPSHRTATAMTFAETTHKIANMVAMLMHRTCRLKMPRPGAYAEDARRSVPTADVGEVPRVATGAGGHLNSLALVSYGVRDDTRRK